LEASKEQYFVDGFMLKYFNVWPSRLEKDNLFEEQKIFLIYLMGFIPDKEEWTLQVTYQKEFKNIKNLKNIKLDKTDIDLARLHNQNLKDIKADKLFQEKKRLLHELNQKFGIKSDEEAEKEKITFKQNNPETPRQQLWDILQAKGLINTKTG
jgi:hypothetical protein